MSDPSGFLQMIASLSQIQNDRKRLKLAEEAQKEQARQYMDSKQVNDFVRTIDLIQKGDSDSRQGLTKLIETLPEQYREVAVAYMTGQPIDPGVLQAGNVQAGQAAMDPRQRAVMQQEAATRAATGMSVGGTAASQLQGQALAGGLETLPPELRNYAQASAILGATTGMNATQAAGQQAILASGQAPQAARIAGGLEMGAGQIASNEVAKANLLQGWKSLDLQEERLADDIGFRKAQIEGGKGVNIGEITTAAGRLLEQMEARGATEGANKMRIQVWNKLIAPTLRLPPFPENADAETVGAITRAMRASGLMLPSVPNPQMQQLPSTAPFRPSPSGATIRGASPMAGWYQP